MNQPLPPSFYDRATPIVAQELLGKVMVRRIGEELLTGKIVETNEIHKYAVSFYNQRKPLHITLMHYGASQELLDKSAATTYHSLINFTITLGQRPLVINGAML